MGKVRNLRRKYHLAANKSKSTSDLTKIDYANSLENLNTLNDNVFKSTENIFAGLDISYDELCQSLPKDFDVKSLVSTKSRRERKEEEKHLKKKDKLKLRHERFMAKLDIIKQAKKAEKERKKRQKTAVVGDMKPLADALPSLESLALEKEKKEKRNSSKKPKGIMKAKKRFQQQAKDVKIFKLILKDNHFTTNPLNTVTQYLQQKIAAER